MVQRDGWKGKPRNDLYLFLGLIASNLVQHAFHPHAFRNVGSHNWGHCFERKNLSIERPTVGDWNLGWIPKGPRGGRS